MRNVKTKLYQSLTRRPSLKNGFVVRSAGKIVNVLVAVPSPVKIVKDTPLSGVVELALGGVIVYVAPPFVVSDTVVPDPPAICAFVSKNHENGGTVSSVFMSPVSILFVVAFGTNKKFIVVQNPYEIPPPISVHDPGATHSFPFALIVELGVDILPPPKVPNPWHTPPHWSVGLNPAGAVRMELVAE